MSDLHMSTGLHEDDDGFWRAACMCGTALGAFPSAEDACDALMQHAREQGFLEARQHGSWR